ncbi:hypothetical protein DPMN_068770 [Dreissena polymorpha]|uniref:Uncharacterized protein n=1 Tax=Dreissena polymorpha TaxID=45954 RepID=A0A9D4BWU9_DREPO|nr:hypothetical protein DPMN_068770 [Dreissena polymorpha]
MGDFPFTLTELRLRPVVNWTNVDEQILAPSVISMSNGFNMHDSLDLLGPPLYMIHISKLEHPEATIHVRSVDHQPNSQVFSKQGQSEKVTMTALHGVDDKNLQLPQGVDDKNLQLIQGVDDKNLQLPHDQELHGERVQKSLPAHCNEYQVFKAQLPGLHNQELHGERVQESLQAHSNEYQVLKAQLPGLHNQELHGERVQESLHAHSNESQVFKAKLPGLHKKTHLATFFSSASAKMRLALGLAHTNLQLPHSLAHASLRLPHCVAQTNMRHPHIVNEMRSRLSHGRSFGSLADEISVLSKYYYFAKDGICQEGDVRGFKMATKSPSDINNTIHGSDEVGSVESNLSESIMYGSDEVKSFESERIENTMDG